MYERITKYRGLLGAEPEEWFGIIEDNGQVFEVPGASRSALIRMFQDDFYAGGFADQDYLDHVRQAGIDFSRADPTEREIRSLDEGALLAVLTFAIRSERFCDGRLDAFARGGLLDCCLEALADWDEDASLPEGVKAAVEEVLAALEKMPEGTSMTPAEALTYTKEGAEAADEGGDTLFGFTCSLYRHASEHGLRLDASSHDGLDEGLPWNLDFMIHHKDRYSDRNKDYGRVRL